VLKSGLRSWEQGVASKEKREKSGEQRAGNREQRAGNREQRAVITKKILRRHSAVYQAVRMGGGGFLPFLLFLVISVLDGQ
jgi:hypothetical protein